ncbi:hypothetical protein AAFF_G00053800 [Aldrovandia affinis]|uniref:Copper transport protein ATOX1 n=1 Tax=Aldrovandia affinis TaxID=143900 RepID=A0AAD7S110_9TELE|nr:hypothetical protein AAFF_G00053800 [Aldrovandia affinis]
MSKHEFFVDMTCEGCSGAVTRVLNKLDVKFDIDLPNKKVFIESDKAAEVLLETLKKTGRPSLTSDQNEALPQLSDKTGACC